MERIINNKKVNFSVLRFSEVKAVVEKYAKIQWNLAAQICDKNNITGIERGQILQNTYNKYNTLSSIYAAVDNFDCVEMIINIAADEPVEMDDIEPDDISLILQHVLCIKLSAEGN